MKNKSFVLCTLLLIALLSSCSSTNPNSSQESKAARMSPELLRSQVLRYKASVEQDEPAVAEFYDSMIPPGMTYTTDTAGKIHERLYNELLKNPEINKSVNRYTENLDNYHFFHEKLKQTGGDMTGLELNIEDDRIDYEKYLSPPIKEPANPHSEPHTPEPT